MKQKIANYGLFSVVAFSLLTGCGGSSSDTPLNEQIVKENGISAETQTQNGGGNRIVAQGQGMSIIPRQSTGDGNYYLAPTVKFAKVGLSNTVEELVYVDENGDNHYGIENIFQTQLKTFGLDLSYDSSNARDNYYNMGHWRNSFVSNLDFDINAEDIKDKSNFYETAREACESGFSDIKDTMYRGILSSATSVYDKNRDKCIIKQDGEDVGKFLVWNKEHKRDDVHYLTTATGDFLLFVKDDEGKFTTEQSGLQITLSQDENGTFSYKDAQDILRKYNSGGKLVYLMKEGQETYIKYGEDGKIAKVKGAMDNVMEFAYNDENLLSKISIGDEAARAELDYNGQKMLSGYKFIISDENGTEQTIMDVHFAYDDKNLLQSIETPEKDMGDGDIIPKSLASYSYDSLNRVSMTSGNAAMIKYIYEKKRVSKLLPNGTEANANISFSGSKQVIDDVTDKTIATQFDYNKKALLTSVMLEETVESNGSQNIESNAFSTKKTLRLQMDYNERGLINSQYIETSDGMKKFTSFEYKTKYNKPTKILTDEEVVFFDFNNKGQLIKKSYLKYDKDMKIKPHTLDEIKENNGYEEYTYSYDENGFIQSVKNELEEKHTNYITLNSGQTIEGNIVSNGFLNSWLSNFLNSSGNNAGIFSYSYKGYINKKTYDIKDRNTRLALVSGAGNISMKGAYKWNRGSGTDTKHYLSYEVGYRNTWKSDIFGKGNKDTLIVMGHSHGGDSAMKAAGKDNVNLLVTIDPVGHIKADSRKVASKTDYWINIYSDPGRQWSYIKVKRGWKRKGWKLYAWVKTYFMPSQWTIADWTAWYGGKYNKIRNADYNIKVPCHHNQIATMLRAMKDDRVGFDINMDISPKKIW